MTVHVMKVPDIGEGIAEVELVAWHVQVGDVVQEDQALADVMTDKASVEIPSPVAGRVAALGGEVGQMLAVGSELIRIETEVSTSDRPPASAPQAAKAAARAEAAIASGASATAGAGAAVVVAVPSSISIRIRSDPTASICPTSPPSASTLPATGDGISTDALSVITSARPWSSAIDSPGWTCQATSSTSAMPSPRSGTRMTWTATATVPSCASAPQRRARGRGSTPTRARAGTACPSR